MTAPQFAFDAKLSGLQLVERWIEQGYVAGLNNRLRARPVAVSPGHVRFECELDSEHENFVGLVHGGVSAALVDIVGGSVAMSLLRPGETLLTVDLQLRYLNPARTSAERLVAEGRAIHHDRRRVVAEVKIMAGGEIAAIGSACMSIRRPESTA